MTLSTLKSKPYIISNRTTDPYISPITPAELADYLSIEYDPSLDDILTDTLSAAGQLYVDYTSCELLERDYVLHLSRWPEYGKSTSGLVPTAAQQRFWIDVPIYPATELTGFTAEGEDVLLNAALHSSDKPSRITVTSPIYESDLIITYKAGYPTAAEINPATLYGVKMLAGWLYEHRGACSNENPILESGAAAIFNADRVIKSL
jgi:uncharacterized phiE125 gp8 family phage protein